MDLSLETAFPDMSNNDCGQEHDDTLVGMDDAVHMYIYTNIHLAHDKLVYYHNSVDRNQRNYRQPEMTHARVLTSQ